MPFTPFHFGPGFLVKSIVPRRFSFRIFILVNVLIDLEALVFILANQYPLHRFFHTFLGATVAALVVLAVGRPVCYWATELWNRLFKCFAFRNGTISPPALISAAFLGAYSQVLLDSMMHADVKLLSPFSSANGWLDLLGYTQLHIACVAMGVVGVVIYFVRKQRGR